MEKQNNTVVFKVNNDTKEKMIAYYQDKLRIKTPPYAIFQAEEAGTIITLYESNKAMFQGSNAKEDSLMWQEINKGNNDVYEIISEDIEEKEKKEKKKEITLPLEINSIGSDEVGTGDYFGPIVVTASYVNKEKWVLQFTIPFEFIDEAFGTHTDTMYANLFKCGDETPHEHYISYSPVNSEVMDFHQSKFFAKFILE